MKLDRKDDVIACWAEASHNRWNNNIYWVLVQEASGRLRLDGLLPDNHSDTMKTLFNVSRTVNSQLVDDVNHNREVK